MLKRNLKCLLLSVLLITVNTIAQAADFRREINLAGKDWQDAITDTINVKAIPKNLSWNKAEVPTKSGAYYKKLKSADHMWQYANVPPEKLVNKDGKFTVTKNRSVWFKREFTIPASYLKNKTVHLVLGGASYRSGCFINGKFAGESIQACLPLDFNITSLVKAGKNTIVMAITTREGLIDPKNRVYIAPSMGATPGIRGPVRLEFRPQIAVEDVFVKTSVSKKNINFQTTISNNGKEIIQITPKITVRSERDPMQVVAEFTGKPITVSPKKEVVTNIKENWVAPILWSMTTPEMYIADVSLFQNGTQIDRYQQTFGFREFTTKGKDCLLNGKRVVQLRVSSLNALKTLEHRPEEVTISRKQSAINSIRQHLGSSNRDLIYQANKKGILVTPESAYSWVKIYPQKPEKAKHWLPGVLEYFKLWARHLRNEPSVVIYNLANETYWERNLPDEMAVAKKIVDVMHREDPTRPLAADGDNSWNGLLDIINIHYPEGSAGTLRKKYINSGLMLPNDLEWLTEKGGESWRAKFKWDRPLFLGEYGGGGDWNSFASFGGDEVFNWIKWQQIKRSGHDIGITNPDHNNYYMNTLQKMTNSYRHKGVACVNPWTGDNAVLLKPIKVVPLDFQPSVDAGGVFKRQIAVFNDGKVPIHKIKYHLVIDGRLVCDKEIKQYVGPGKKWSDTLEIPIPKIEYPAEGKLTVRVLWNRNANNFLEQDRFTEKIFIVPQINLSRYADRISLIDTKGSMKQVLSKLGLGSITPIQGDKIPKGKKMLIIGVDSYSKSMKKMLNNFVENGGCVLMLAQKNWKPFRAELPERDARHATTQCWARMPSHPALNNMHEEQLSFWGKDNVLSYETFSKPQQGPLNVVVDSGGRFGMRWAPLLDIPIGKGTFLMTTLELTKEEPAARQLLSNLIRYGCLRKPRTLKKLNILAGKNAKLTETLFLTGAVFSEGIGKSGPILVDGSAKVNVNALKKALQQGRTVWLHGFTPQTLSKVSSLLPPGSKLKKVPKEKVGTMPVAKDKLISGLANFDFAWYIPKMYWGGPLFQGASAVAKTGDWVLDTNLFSKDVKQLTAPAFMVKTKYGKGTILFDTLQWENAVGKETDKSLRIASGILTNMDCEFEFPDSVDYDYKFVNFAKSANMSYMDRTADDGVGGWTDQGLNDMRFFLINHSGKGNGREDGMDVPVPNFPTNVEFAGVPFKLIDPKANNNKAVLSFGSVAHSPKLMRQAKDIPVNFKADILWIVHALGWAQGQANAAVAEYTVNYSDGTSVKFPIRRFVDVGDWFSPAKYSNANIAWTGKNLKHSPVGLNIMPWKNPHPDKKIKSISIKAGLTESQYVVVGITGGKASGGTGKTVMDINFENNFQPDYLRNGGANPATKVADGMEFSHGSQITFSGKQSSLTDFLKKPFAIAFDFTPKEKPDGYCAGLVETGPFRITLKKGSMKVTVETFAADGKRVYIESKNPVDLNKRVRFEFKSDGKKGILMRNGKIDAIGQAALPKHDIVNVRLGKAGGKDYNFNGTIHQVAFKDLSETK